MVGIRDQGIPHLDKNFEKYYFLAKICKFDAFRKFDTPFDYVDNILLVLSVTSCYFSIAFCFFN